MNAHLMKFLLTLTLFVPATVHAQVYPLNQATNNDIYVGLNTVAECYEWNGHKFATDRCEEALLAKLQNAAALAVDSINTTGDTTNVPTQRVLTSLGKIKLLTSLNQAAPLPGSQAVSSANTLQAMKWLSLATTLLEFPYSDFRALEDQFGPLGFCESLVRADYLKLHTNINNRTTTPCEYALKEGLVRLILKGIVAKHVSHLK